MRLNKWNSLQILKNPKNEVCLLAPLFYNNLIVTKIPANLKSMGESPVAKCFISQGERKRIMQLLQITLCISLLTRPSIHPAP